MMAIEDRPRLTRQRVIGIFKLYFQLDRTPPTVRDLCHHVSLRSASTIHRHLRQLTREGVLTHMQGKARSYELSLTQKRAVAIANFEAYWQSADNEATRFAHHDLESVLYETALRSWLRSRGLDETQT